MENLELYNKLRTVPQNARKTIAGGRLKGMTDIKPMWRIEKLTETFGICGIGWKTKVLNKEILEGANGEKIATVDIELYVKIDNEWSEAIYGTGGSSFIANERNGLYTSDECFKMAYTDALSVACKSLGMGADVYWGDNKYNSEEEQFNKKVEDVRKAKIDKTHHSALISAIEKYSITDEQIQAILQKYNYSNTAEILNKDYTDICKEFEKVVKPKNINEI